MPLTPGTRLGSYEILAPLGAGGMGEVYRAQDHRLGRDVAVKLLRFDGPTTPDQLARFEREARTVAGLNHPNIVTLFSFEDVDRVLFLTMELVDGQSLDRLVAAGGLAVPRVIDIGIAITDALSVAHAKGIVHRDLKPGNVMLTRDGRVKVLDFGLAKLVTTAPGVEPSQARTMTALESGPGVVVGTVPYMAPEQIRGELVDPRTDLFALGVLLYELAAGRRPFAGATLADIGSSILRDDPAPLSAGRSQLQELERVIRRCLEKHPGQRFQTASELGKELRGLQLALARTSSAPPTREGADLASIAVLPFDNRGKGEEDEYFADGITEDVIAQLCKVRTLKVISSTSVMPFKRHRESLPEIAAKLEVAHVLEGSVRRVGERVRIVAQLVDPGSGRNLWAETYDRSLTDIFEIQTDVALNIATALRAELTSNERERIQREPTRDLQAYELYLRGRQSLIRFNVEGMLGSIDFFDRAISRDPEYAPAYVGLALGYTELAEHGIRGRAEAGALALAAARKAVQLDPDLGDAHCALAYVRMFFEMDWAKAEAGFKRALELSPGGAFAYDLYGRMCAGLERFDEAIVLQEKAHELDPLVQRADLATTLLRAGRNEEAARLAEHVIQMEPDSARLRATHGWALFRQGKREEGIEALRLAVTLAPREDMWLAQLGEALAMSGATDRAEAILKSLQDPARPTPASPYHLAYVYTGLGDAERAIDCLELALEKGDGPVYGIKGSFLLTPLREHPRFVALVKRMRVPLPGESSSGA